VFYKYLRRADSLARFSLKKEATNQIFNIGNTEPTTIKELAGKIVTSASQRAVAG